MLICVRSSIFIILGIVFGECVFERVCNVYDRTISKINWTAGTNFRFFSLLLCFGGSCGNRFGRPTSQPVSQLTFFAFYFFFFLYFHCLNTHKWNRTCSWNISYWITHRSASASDCVCVSGKMAATKITLGQFWYEIEINSCIINNTRKLNGIEWKPRKSAVRALLRLSYSWCSQTTTTQAQNHSKEKWTTRNRSITFICG